MSHKGYHDVKTEKKSGFIGFKALGEAYMRILQNLLSQTAMPIDHTLAGADTGGGLRGMQPPPLSLK